MINELGDLSSDLTLFEIWNQFSNLSTFELAFRLSY